MWLLFARAPPDAPYWPGRRWLAAVDAVAWPTAWIALATQLQKPTGIAGPFVITLAIVLAARRLHRALVLNHCYRFTTWRWGRIVVALVAFGMALRIVLSA